MPLWRIFHSPETFNAEQKAALAVSITEIYTGVGLPAFYVDVVFVPVATDSLFVGGKLRTNFVRIAIEHIARRSTTEERKKFITGLIDDTLAPHIKSRGLDWEYHISETPRELWKINGIAPPPSDSEAEKKWILENKVTPW